MNAKRIIEHLCTTCKKKFEFCDGFPTFAEDIYEKLQKKLRDNVVECAKYSVTTTDASPNKPNKQ